MSELNEDATASMSVGAGTSRDSLNSKTESAATENSQEQQPIPDESEIVAIQTDSEENNDCAEKAQMMEKKGEKVEEKDMEVGDSGSPTLNEVIDSEKGRQRKF